MGRTFTGLTIKEKKMTEYIDKKETMQRLKAAYDGSVAVHGDNDNLFADGIDYAMDIVRDIKAADAVSVIRCKDCKWYGRDKLKGGFCRKPEASMWSPGLPIDELKPDDYCSRAKRKENINGN